MKKLFIALALTTGLAVATAALAGWGRGGGGYGGYGYCPQAQGMMQGQMMPQLDQATQDKIAQFFKDTQALHKEMAMKHAEKQALMQSTNPDPKAVAKVAGEMFDLRTSIHDKAVQAGVDQYLGCGCKGHGGMGRGGMGRGWRGPGSGMGPGMMNGGPQQ